MLTSFALILLVGVALGGAAQRLKLPRLVGMLLGGILLGPSVLNWLSPTMLGISSDLRQLALIMILTRAGLSLNLADLKRVGRPAVLMCFLPACFEILGMVVLAPPLLGISRLDAAILGAVVGAVSPAVIVPRMLRLMEEGWGNQHCIPQLVLAGASVDDVFVIVVFTAFTGVAQGGTFSPLTFAAVPVSIVLGLFAGILLGAGLSFWFRAIHMRDSVKVVLIVSISCLLVAAQDGLQGWSIPFSGLLAVMGLGIGLQRWRDQVAVRLRAKFSKLWVGAEILLFVLVGAEVDVSYAASAGLAAVWTVLGALCFRALGVFLCLLYTPIPARERLFCVIAYLPKATVQAAIGGIPLAMGLACGELVLTVAVIAILVTAPLGALGIDWSYSRLLSPSETPSA